MKGKIILLVLVFMIGLIAFVSAQEDGTIVCYQDSDCGGSIYGTFCEGSQLCTSQKVYTCQNAGTTSSECSLKEGKTCASCQYGCENSACLTSAVVCGDGVCNAGETETSCQQDCGV